MTQEIKLELTNKFQDEINKLSGQININSNYFSIVKDIDKFNGNYKDSKIIFTVRHKVNFTVNGEPKKYCYSKILD